MHLKFSFRLAVLVFAFSIQNAFSSTIFSEDTLGDFHGGQLFVLGSGENIFTGSQLWGSDQVDGFRFIVQPGYGASISFDFNISGLSEAGGLSWVWDLNKLPTAEECIPSDGMPYSCLPPIGAELLASEIFEYPVGNANPSNWDAAAIDGIFLSDGAYQINDNYGFAQDGGGLFSYAIAVHVTPVPLPSPLILYGTSLFILPFLRAKPAKKETWRTL